MRLWKGLQCGTSPLCSYWENERSSWYKNKECASVLTDLSKAFGCLKHDLLIAKLNVFGFNFKSMRLINTYLRNRVQLTKVGSFYSEIVIITFGVSQNSILGSLLFNIHVIDISLIEQYKSNFTVMKITPYHIIMRPDFWKLY